MDIYHSSVNYLLRLPIFDCWQEMKWILQRMASTQPRDWELPVIACQAVGESTEKAIPASAALACAQISIILVDDMLDDDPRGEYHRIGSGRASNLALAFQAASIDALMKSDANPAVRLAAVDSLNHMMLTTAYGQELDIQNPVDEDSYWRVVENKSAPFYEGAIQLGARLAEAGENATNNLEQLGRLYGAMIQIHDDLNDTMTAPANPDWLQKRKPLPILFALTVEHPDQARFIQLYEDIAIGGALQEAQQILIRCGAVSYCVDQLIRRHQTVQEILAKTPLANKDLIDSLIRSVIDPVWRLFEALGISPNHLPTPGELSDRA